MRAIRVTVHKNGEYWRAQWYLDGKRASKSLGARAKVSKRAATVLAARLAEQLNAGRSVTARAPALGELIQRHLDNHPEYSAGTVAGYRQSERYLTGHFGSDRRADTISKADARVWRTMLAKGDFAHLNKRDHGQLSEATVCRCVRDVKAIFNEAAEDDVVSLNPFGKLTSTAPRPIKNWEYIDVDKMAKLLDACPNMAWRLLLSLCRWAGLRQGEALALTWSDVDLGEHRLRATNLKTGGRTGILARNVPIRPELHDLLFEAYMADSPSQKVVAGLVGTNLWRDVQVIAKRAGLTPWAKWCHTLRKNCDTDWLGEYDVFTVCEWMGHGPEVAKEHYHQAKPEAFRQAAGVDNGSGSRDTTEHDASRNGSKNGSKVKPEYGVQSQAMD